MIKTVDYDDTKWQKWPMRFAAAIFLASFLAENLFAGSGPLWIADVDEVYPIVPHWPGLKVLHIGDSHVSAGLKTGLSRRLKAAGAKYVPICWEGSQAKSWVVSGRLRRLIRKQRPDVVIITLGTNIMTNAEPERYSGWVRALVERIGPRTCYWLGPPPLLDDPKGFNDMLAANSTPCRYFDARDLDIPKRKDGKFHMTRAQGEEWASRVWAWMNGGRTPGPELGANAL